MQDKDAAKTTPGGNNISVVNELSSDYLRMKRQFLPAQRSMSRRSQKRGTAYLLLKMIAPSLV